MEVFRAINRQAAPGAIFTIHGGFFMLERLRGYVVAFDRYDQGKVCWRVRVTDRGEHYWKKFWVISVADGVELWRGMRVSFCLNMYECRVGKKKAVRVVLKACDVKPCGPPGDTTD